MKNSRRGISGFTTFTDIKQLSWSSPLTWKGELFHLKIKVKVSLKLRKHFDPHFLLSSAVKLPMLCCINKINIMGKNSCHRTLLD